jgi:hypothetical protein
MMKCVCCIFLLCLTSFFSNAHQYDVFEENGKVGLKNDQGQIVIPAQYEALGWSNNRFSLINKVTGYKHRGRWGLITIDNHKVTEAEYETLDATDGPLIIAKKKSTTSLRIVAGCINSSGKVVVPLQYDGLKISALRAIVYTRSGNQYKYGLIDLTNKLIIPQQYNDIQPLGSLRFAVENTTRKLAIFTEEGRQLTDFTIDSISFYQKNFAIIYQGERQGLIDRDGHIKANPIYREIKIADNEIQARLPDEWIFLNGDNKIVQRTNADSVKAVSKDLYKIRQVNKVAFADTGLKQTGDGPFDAIGDFREGKAYIESNGRKGIIGDNAKLIIEPQFESLWWNTTYVLAGKKHEGKIKWAILDLSGKQKTSRLYDRIEQFNGTIYKVKNKGYWGAVNEEGREIIACVYDSILEQRGNYLAVRFRNQYGIISLKEEWIVTPKYNISELIDDSHYIERTPKTWFLKSFAGEVIYFSDNRFESKEDHILEYLPSGTVWKIDLQGRISERQAPPEEPVEKIFPEQEGLRAIQRDRKFGFVDNRGRLRIANRYEDVYSFSEGLAAAKIRGKWGFINHQDKIAIQPTYEQVTSFGGGFALVKQKGLNGLIDIKGNQVLPPRYDNIEVLSSKRLRITQNNLLGLADANGKVLINPKFDSLEDLDNGYIIVGREGKFGLINTQGISTIPLMYDLLTFDSFHSQYIVLKKSGWQILKF